MSLTSYIVPKRLFWAIKAVTADAKTSLKVFMVPLPRNPNFLGRGDIIAQLEARLTFSEPGGKSQSRAISKAALCGLGGIGYIL